MWVYKMYFLADGEFFECDTFGGQGSTATQIALPYLESLLIFLEMDCTEWEPLIQQTTAIWKTLPEYCSCAEVGEKA